MDVMSDRQKEILALAQVAGRVEVDDMAARFAVSPQTIRKDLNEICALNLLHRVHGGAVMVAGVENLRYESRRLLAQDEKRNIGRAAAALVPDNSSLFINIGTTTEAVAHHLRNRSDLLVITNNMNVANILRPIDSIDVIVVGGLFRSGFSRGGFGGGGISRGAGGFRGGLASRIGGLVGGLRAADEGDDSGEDAEIAEIGHDRVPVLVYGQLLEPGKRIRDPGCHRRKPAATLVDCRR